MTIQYRLADLIDGLDVVLKGDPNCVITGVSTIQDSLPGQITFLTNPLYRKHLATTKASAVILSEKDAAECPSTLNAIVSKNPHFTYAKIAAFFDHKIDSKPGIHPTAVVDETAEIGQNVSVGPHCVIGKGVKIAANTIIGAGSYVGDYAEIDEAAIFDPKVTIYHHVKIGKRTRLATGVVIGSEGFGFANQNGMWHKVAQLGSVEIGDDVDIGANTTIDRGAIENTIIEDGVKLDNLIQIGHNVRIGAHTIIAGCTGVAGSTTIGKHCMIGGASLITGHITIADKVIVTGGTGVSKSILEPGVYSSGIVGVVTNAEFRKNNARFHRLGSLMDRVKEMEATLKTLEEREK